jgi:hypothetical protein
VSAQVQPVALVEELTPSWLSAALGRTVTAVDAVVNLAGLHGPRWSDPALLDIEGINQPTEADGDLMDETFPGAVELTLELLGELVPAQDAQTMRTLAPLIGRWVAARPAPYALVHGDYRLDNLLFPPDGPGVQAVDWQSVSVGLPARDVAYFLGTGLTVADRRPHERNLIAAYHAAMLERGCAAIRELGTIAAVEA